MITKIVLYLDRWVEPYIKIKFKTKKNFIAASNCKFLSDRCTKSSKISMFTAVVFVYLLVYCCDLTVLLTRWGKLRTPIIPLASLLEPLSECVPLGVIMSWCVWMMFNINPAMFFLAHCMIWFTFDLLLMYTVQVCGQGRVTIATAVYKILHSKIIFYVTEWEVWFWFRFA